MQLVESFANKCEIGDGFVSKADAAPSRECLWEPGSAGALAALQALGEGLGSMLPDDLDTLQSLTNKGAPIVVDGP